MGSIRTYLLWRLLGGTALILLAAGAAVFLVVKRSLLAQFDANLADRVQGFASILFQVKDDVSFEFSDQLMPEYEREELPDYFQLWFADGRLLERSNSLSGKDLAIRIRENRRDEAELAQRQLDQVEPLGDGGTWIVGRWPDGVDGFEGDAHRSSRVRIS